MPVLTDQQIASAARAAGFVGPAIRTATAVALAESSGNSDATNTNSDGSIDRGLMQINSVHDGKLPGQNRFDPLVSMKLALIISGNGTNWTPWTVYKSGAINEYGTRAAVASGQPDVPFPTGGGTGSSGGSALDFFTNTGLWARVGVFLLGGLLLLFALWELTGGGIPLPGAAQASKVLKRATKVVR